MLKILNALTVLSYPFRIFFLACGIYAIFIIAAWMAILLGSLNLPLAWTPLYWHSHEMIFGVVTAAICGFLLTAMCNWTGAPPLKGAALFGVISLWIAGRAVMWLGNKLPLELVMVVDAIFLPVVTAYVAYILLRHGNKRNLILALILTLLSVCNISMHAGAYTKNYYWLWAGETSALGLITLIMVIIAGRIIPLFTINGLRGQGYNVETIKNSSLLSTLAIASTALLIPLNFFTQYPNVIGVVALIAAVVNAVRLAQWAGFATKREPLLWILHVGYAWIVIALVLKSMAAFNMWIAPSVWQHALGLGAMSSLILGMMTRVSLGHTGRPLSLPRFGVVIYLAISVAAITRLLVALSWIDFQIGLILTTIAWIVAFGFFTVLYYPILTKPRR
jgi:uncharacterized protein involved in response to NO